jgi:hypothetical protein
MSKLELLNEQLDEKICKLGNIYNDFIDDDDEPHHFKGGSIIPSLVSVKAPSLPPLSKPLSIKKNELS